MKKLILITILGMGIIGAIIWFSVQPDMYGGKTIPLEYVLKAPKEKILNYKEVDGIIQYLYVSDVEVLTADFKGLKEDITQRTANTQFFKTGKTKNGQEEYVAKVYGGNPFYNDKGKWYQTETAFTTVEAFNSQTKVSFFKKLLGKALADIFYSGTGDGRITYLTTDLTWATAHNASAGTGLAYVNAEVIGPGTGKTAAGQFRMSRNFFPFNTSALPDNAVISAASFNIYVTSTNNGDNDGQDYVNIVQTTQALTTALVLEDYDQCGATHNPSLGATAIDIGNITEKAYNAWTLNATGTAWISLTATTTLGTREGHDLEDAAYAGANETENSITVIHSEAPGITYDPYLSITYTLPSAIRPEIIIFE